MENLNIIVCPNCGGELFLKGSAYECVDCRSVFNISRSTGIINLLPSSLEENKLNEERHYKEDVMEGIDSPDWMALIHKRENVRFLWNEFLPRNKTLFTGQILEIGAGTCWASSLIKLKFPFVEIIATDISTVALEKGLKVCNLLNSNIRYYIAADVERLPFRGESFDVVFGAAIIHHLPNTRSGLLEIHRVLKKGGWYLGIMETGSSALLKFILNRGFTPGKRRATELGITESIISFNEWLNLFRSVGFSSSIDIEKNLAYKLEYRWYLPLYYRIISYIPDYIIRLFLASSITIAANKQT